MALAIFFVRKGGSALADLGLRLSLRTAATIAGLLVALGAGMVCFRQLVSYSADDTDA